MKRTVISMIALTLCVLLSASCLAACGAKSALIGSWDSIEAPGTVYTFNADGSGTLDASGSVLKFTYTDKDGMLTLTYEGSSTPQTSAYTVKDNVLSLTDTEYGTTLTYKKK